MNDKRAAPRHKVFKAGTIEFHGGAVDCTVRNLSNAGAALEVASPLGIPEDMTLIVPVDHRKHHCHVVWRKEKRIGVAFND